MIVDVGSVDEFREGRPKGMHVSGRELAVLKWRGEFFATSGRCPHMTAPLCGGLVSQKLESREVGSMEVNEQAPMISCPWHGWQFDLRTGCSVWDPRYRIVTYPVERKGDRVFVHIRSRRASEQNDQGT